ncbi:MAG: site-2 protease family protein [Patescibacteria group bacterium]
MEIITFIFSLIILIMSVVIHELSHGYTADALGDPTPSIQGRLTLNPLKHLDFFGSFIVPVVTSMAGFTFGWAKPIEWNPYNIKNKRLGELLISLAGPLSNFLIALVFAIVIRIFGDMLSVSFMKISYYVIVINIALAVFNMVPIPPLDGSKVFFSLLPSKLFYIREFLERYSIVFFLIVIFFLWRFIEPIIPYIFKIIVGI